MSVVPVYLDYAATTPLDKRLGGIVESHLGGDMTAGNPSSVHIAGRLAAARIDVARCQLAKLLGCDPQNLVWTSGATEADNLAIQGAARFREHRGKHIVTVLTEHKAVTDTFRALANEGFDVTWLKPDENGLLDFNRFEDALRADTQLVSIMHVNNETGVVQNVQGIGEICRARDILFHCDAAQSAGKLEIDLGKLPIDLLSVTAHKFYGPQGIGALYIAERPGCNIAPIMFGGGQERRKRPGTLPVRPIIAFGAAAEIALHEMSADLDHVRQLNNVLAEGLDRIPDILRNGRPQDCYPGIVNVSVGGVEGESLMLALEPVCVASGSACNSTSGESSYVLRALGLTDEQAQSALRISFGRGTTFRDIECFLERLAWATAHLRGLAPTTRKAG